MIELICKIQRVYPASSHRLFQPFDDEIPDTKVGEALILKREADSNKYLCRRVLYRNLSVHLSKSTVFGPVLLILLIAFGAAVTNQFPTLSVGGVIVSKPVIVGLIGGLLLVALIISHYRSGEPREWTQWVLFGVGIVLALAQQPPFNWIGVLAIFLSFAVKWEIDQRLFKIVPR